jgi:hypothetical protein
MLQDSEEDSEKLSSIPSRILRKKLDIIEGQGTSFGGQR